MIPDIMRSAKKSTMIGVELVDRQWGNIQASRRFDNSASWKSGLGSINSPVHYDR